MPQQDFFHVFFYGQGRDADGMVSPYNSYIFFIDINEGAGITEVEVLAACKGTKIPSSLTKYLSKYIKKEDVCDEVFDILSKLPENAGLQYRRFF